jgi:hypothetical protein
MSIKYIFFIIAIQFLTLSTASSKEKSPIFDGSTLKIPMIDSLENPGEYQDVEFSLNENGEWKLSNYAIKEKLGGINKVEMIKTSSSPTQVFLKVSGAHGACQTVGQVRVVLERDHFNVTLYNGRMPLARDMFCSQNIVSFSKDIPLPVLFLEKGSYTYTINDNLSGTFELPSDNDIPVILRAD